MIRFHCEHCGQRLSFAEQYVGREVSCLRCGKINTVPAKHSKDAQPKGELTILFKCQGCGRNLKASPRFSGRKTNCPKCGEPMVVPDEFEELSISELTNGSGVDDEQFESHVGTTEFLKELGEDSDIDNTIDKALGMDEEHK